MPDPESLLWVSTKSAAYLPRARLLTQDLKLAPFLPLQAFAAFAAPLSRLFIVASMR